MRCGVGDYTSRLASALARESGVQVSVLTSAGPALPGEEAAGVDPMRLLPDWRLRRLPRLLRELRRLSPALVHIQYPTRGYGRGLLPMLLPLALWLYGYQLAQTWHEEFRARHWPEFLLKALVPSDLVVVRPAFRANLPRLFRLLLGARPLHYIANGSPLPVADPPAEQRAQLRREWLRGQQRLVVFSGFVMPGKGVELLFDIADPASDQLVIAGQCDDAALGALIESRRTAGPWQGKVTMAGFLPPEELAMLLALADAVVLPFRSGGGVWNSSIHGASAQGSFVLSTSREGEGYYSGRNIHFAHIDDIAGMRAALAQYSGTRREPVPADAEWAGIARSHLDVYRRRAGSHA